MADSPRDLLPPADAGVFEIARSAVCEAAAVCRAVRDQSDTVDSLTKADASPVTIADFASQAVIAHRLQEAFGETALVGEETADAVRESSEVLDAVVAAVQPVWPDASPDAVVAAIDSADHDGSGESYWAVDPIDGTKGFIAGRQYAISLVLMIRRRPFIGALACPHLAPSANATLDVADTAGTVFVSHPEAGCWWWPGDEPAGAPGGRACPGSTVPRPLVGVRSVEAAHSQHDVVERLLKAVDPQATSIGCDSQAKYGVVARSQAHVYVRIPREPDRVEWIWDHAPGAAIATAAGNVVSDLHGNPLDYTTGRGLKNNYGIVCAHSSVHARVVAAARELGL